MKRRYVLPEKERFITLSMLSDAWYMVGETILSQAERFASLIFLIRLPQYTYQ